MSLKYDFTGKLILVTGSTSGIGKVIAEQYVKSGANVIINSRKEHNVNETVKELTQKHLTNRNSNKQQKIYGFAANVGRSSDCNKLIDFVNKIGHLDILINNAGIFYIKSFETLTDKEWIDIFKINVMSTVRLCRAFLPKMLEIDEKTKKPKGGNIIIISSDSGIRSSVAMMHYAMTKAAQLNISRGLAELTKGIDNVRVNSIMPGPTMTEKTRKYMKGYRDVNGYGDDEEKAEKEWFKRHEPTSIKSKFLASLEIANVALFLSSDDASGINGTAVKVEGGIIKSMI